MTPKQAERLFSPDTNLSPEARVLTQYVDARGSGDWVEISSPTIGRLLQCKDPRKVRRTISEAADSGWIKHDHRTGKGHPSRFRFRGAQNAPPSEVDTDAENARPNDSPAKNAHPKSDRGADSAHPNPVEGAKSAQPNEAHIKEQARAGAPAGARHQPSSASIKRARENGVNNSAPMADDDRHRPACAAFVAQAGYGQREALIAQGEDATAWNTPTGERVPWPDRLRMLRLADARVKDRKNDNLRSALRYVIPEQYDPFKSPKSELPRPGSEAARVAAAGPRSETPGGHRIHEPRKEGGMSSVTELLARERFLQETAKVERWKADHPEDVTGLRKAAAAELGRAEDAAIPVALLDGIVRRMVLERIHLSHSNGNQ